MVRDRTGPRERGKVEHHILGLPSSHCPTAHCCEVIVVERDAETSLAQIDLVKRMFIASRAGVAGGEGGVNIITSRGCKVILRMFLGLWAQKWLGWRLLPLATVPSALVMLTVKSGEHDHQYG